MVLFGSLVPWVMGSWSRRAAIHSLMPYSSASSRAGHVSGDVGAQWDVCIHTLIGMDPDIPGHLLGGSGGQTLDVILLFGLLIQRGVRVGGLEHAGGADEAVGGAAHEEVGLRVLAVAALCEDAAAAEVLRQGHAQVSVVEHAQVVGLGRVAGAHQARLDLQFGLTEAAALDEDFICGVGCQSRSDTDRVIARVIARARVLRGDARRRVRRGEWRMESGRWSWTYDWARDPPRAGGSSPRAAVAWSP